MKKSIIPPAETAECGLYAHDLTKLFAGIATRARLLFGIKVEQVHVDTTSFSVSGEYGQAEKAEGEAVIAITYGYSRDHRAERTAVDARAGSDARWRRATFPAALDGNSSDKVSLLSAITAIRTQLREAEEEASVYVADTGIDSESNMRRLNQASVKWVSRVLETMTEAKALIQQGSESWQQSEDGTVHWFSRELELPQGRERWVVVYTQASLQRVQQTLQRQVSKAQTKWEQVCWHLGNQRFACETDARVAAERELKGTPVWLDVRRELVAHPQYAGKGRPRKDANPANQQWQMVATITANQERVTQETFRNACWIVGTNVLEPPVLSDQQLIATYKGQGGAERGCALSQRPTLSGILRHGLETRAHYGTQFHHGPLPARLSLSRSATTRSVGRNPSRPFPIKSTSRQHVLPCGSRLSMLRRH